MFVVAECEADITVLVDHSGSICNNEWPTRCDPDNWNITVKFLRTLIRGLDVGLDRTRVAVISFSNKAMLDFDLDDHHTREATEAAVGRIKYGDGETNTTGALRLMRTRVFTPRGGDRRAQRNIAILVTDGNPSVSREAAGLMAEVKRI